MWEILIHYATMVIRWPPTTGPRVRSLTIRSRNVIATPPLSQLKPVIGMEPWSWHDKTWLGCNQFWRWSGCISMSFSQPKKDSFEGHMNKHCRHAALILNEGISFAEPDAGGWGGGLIPVITFTLSGLSTQKVIFITLICVMANIFTTIPFSEIPVLYS